MSGNQGDRWIKGQAAISPAVAAQKFQIVFEGVIGRGHRGDIALDDVTITSGSDCARGGQSGGM